MYKFIMPLLSIILVVFVGQTAKMYLPSAEASASLNQIRTETDAVLERTLVQTNTGNWITLIQCIGVGCIIGIFVYNTFRKNNEKSYPS